MRLNYKVIKVERSLILCWAAIGALVAFPVVAQLVNAKLADTASALWGSALGAVAAVAGAFWVADRQAAQQRKAAAALVSEMFFHSTFALSQLAVVYGPPSRSEKEDREDDDAMLSVEEWNDVAIEADLVIAQHKKFITRQTRFESALNLLSGSAFSRALALETELEDVVRDVVTPLLVRPHIYDDTNGTIIFCAGPPKWSNRHALAISNLHVEGHMAELNRQAR